MFALAPVDSTILSILKDGPLTRTEIAQWLVALNPQQLEVAMSVVNGRLPYLHDLGCVTLKDDTVRLT